MNVLSLFDGISVGHAALVEAGIPVTSYYASEIDKHAIKVTMKNFPGTVQLGDVCGVKLSDLPIVPDIVLAGSPCQGLSFAGKQLAFEDPRSMLFWEFIRILKEVQAANPDVWFLLENVIMKQESSRIITKALGVSPIRINSNLVSAQNRDRLYWTNIPYFLPPQDRGIMLRNIIHENTDGMDIEKYKVPITRAFKLLDSELNKRKIGLIHEKDTQSSRVYSIHGKAICLSGAGGGGAVNMGQYLIQEPHGCSVGGIIDSKKHPALSVNSSGNTYLANMVPEARAVQVPRGKMKGGIYQVGKAPTMAGNDYSYNNPVACFGVVRPDKEKTYQRARINEGDKSYTLVHGANNGILVGTEPQPVLGCISPDREEKRQNGQRFNNGDKFYTLTAQDQHGILTDGYIRKLTPIECCRLQTLPDDYTEGISPTQQYRALGNGWTRDVIAYIFEGLKDQMNLEMQEPA